MGKKNFVLSAISLCALSLMLGVAGCKNATFMASPPVPYVPVEYYSCTEVDPQVLLEAYYSNYNAVSQTEFKYNGKVFVFKNIEVDSKELTCLAKGYLWAAMNKCVLANTAGGKGFRVGDKVDVVGINQGLGKDFRGLAFSDCYVMPAGSIALPAAGSGGSFSAGY